MKIPHLTSWFLLWITLAGSCNIADDDPNPNQSYAGTFVFSHALTLPGTPEQIYDACTGELSAWWDHSFSEKPLSIFLDARPGGSFEHRGHLPRIHRCGIRGGGVPAGNRLHGRGSGSVVQDVLGQGMERRYGGPGAGWPRGRFRRGQGLRQRLDSSLSVESPGADGL